MLVLVVFPWSKIRAQDASKQRQQRKTFGFSLRKTKQDSTRSELDSANNVQEVNDRKSGTDDDTIKTETVLAVFDFLVIDRSGKPVEDLKREDLLVTEDNIQQDVALFTKGHDARNPRSIILILEWSNTAHYVENSLLAAQTFIEQLAPQDKVAIVTSDIKLACDFTSDKNELKAALRLLREKVSRNSRESIPAELDLPRQQFEFETLVAVLQELLEGPSRHIILFQADGGEALYLSDQSKKDNTFPTTARRISLSDVLSAVTKSNATIYPIIPDYQYVGIPPAEQFDRARHTLKDQVRYLPESQANLFLSSSKLRNIIHSALTAQTVLMQIGAVSGAWSSFLERPDQATYIYSRILADANERYILGYYVTDKRKDGRLRNVRIQVRGHPEYTVQGRKTYSIR